MPIIDDAFIAELKRSLGEGSPSGAPSTGKTDRLTSLDSEGERDAFKKIQRLASVRERSVSELRERLAKDGFDGDAAETALSRAQELGIVDDARYAEVLVRTRLAAGKGKRGIAAELKSRDIDPETVSGLHEEEADDEVERALQVLRRRPPTAKNKRDAAYRRLIAKGYSASAAQTAARLWSEEEAEKGYGDGYNSGDLL